MPTVGQPQLIDLLSQMQAQNNIDWPLLLKEYGPTDINVFLRLLQEVEKEVFGYMYEATKYDPAKEVWKLRIGDREVAAKYIKPDKYEVLSVTNDLLREHPWLDAPFVWFGFDDFGRHVAFTDHADEMTLADEFEYLNSGVPSEVARSQRSAVLDSVVDNYLIYMFYMDDADPFDGFVHKDADYSISKIAEGSSDVYGVSQLGMHSVLDVLRTKISSLEAELKKGGIDGNGIDFCLPYYDIWIFNLLQKKSVTSDGQVYHSFVSIDTDNADKKRSCLTSLAHLDNILVGMSAEEEAGILEDVVSAIAVYQSGLDDMVDVKCMSPSELGKIIQYGKDKISDEDFSLANQLFNLVAILKDLKMISSYLRPDYIDDLVNVREDITTQLDMAGDAISKEYLFLTSRLRNVNEQINQFYEFIDGYFSKIEERLGNASDQGVISNEVVHEFLSYVNIMREEELSIRNRERSKLQTPSDYFMQSDVQAHSLSDKVDSHTGYLDFAQ